MKGDARKPGRAAAKAFANGHKWRLCTDGRWHLFVFRDRGSKTYTSCCDRITLSRAYGQRLTRPPAVMRCGICGGVEMDQLGRDDSAPESPTWQDYDGVVR